MIRQVLAGVFVSALVAALFVGYLGWELRSSEQSMLAWPSVPGRVLSIEVRRMPRPGISPTATNAMHVYWGIDLRYAYSVGGRSFVGQRLSNDPPFEKPSSDPRPPANLLAIANRYPPGAAVQVRHHPSRPQESLLEVATAGGRAYLSAAVVAAAVALAAGIAWMRLGGG